MTRAVLPLAILTAAILFLTQSGVAQTHSASASHANGAHIFRTSCAMCHGDDGTGTAMGQSLHIPNLRSAMIQKKSNAALERFISDGSGAMPPFKTTLSHQQILDAVHYVRSFRGHREAR